MSLLQRSARVVTACLIFFLVYFVYEHTGWVPNLRAHEFSPNLPSIPQGDNVNEVPSEPVEDLPLPESAEDNPAPEPEADPITVPGDQDLSFESSSTVRDDAHTLPDADDFLQHIEDVINMEGMTIREAKSGCTWTGEEHVNLQYGPDDDWVVKDRSDEELEMRRQQWHDFVGNSTKELVPWGPHKDKFSGRGIVIVAGKKRSIKRVQVTLRQLAKLGSEMPVELHYYDKELNETTMDELRAMWPDKIFFNDLSSPDNVLRVHYSVFMVNYQLKTAAMINSRFAEPLLLDSDNIPVIDPASLYESDVYQEYGTLFWPDIARTRPSNPMWPITNTKCRMDEFEQESGQMIVDKRKFFYHLQLAAWFNDVHAEYYNVFLLGDKDMFRFAWHALKTKYGKPSKWLTSVGTYTMDFYCGHSFAQHHPNGEVAFLHGGLAKTIPKVVMKWYHEKRGGIFQVYKRSQYDEQHATNVRVGLKWDPVEYMPNRPKDLDIVWCADIWEAKPQPFNELVPGWEDNFEDIGGYWMLDEPDEPEISSKNSTGPSVTKSTTLSTVNIKKVSKTTSKAAAKATSKANSKANTKENAKANSEAKSKATTEAD